MSKVVMRTRDFIISPKLKPVLQPGVSTNPTPPFLIVRLIGLKKKCMYVIGLTGRYMEIVIICAFPKMFYFSKNNADIDGQESFPPRQKDINTILRTHTNAYF